ncbi:MAG: hypothetical protein KAQ64_04640 [Candidatus Pacebacteria bacterium]|nr:hypothetical protein [Candidatus Paceibacterota bacterium]
MSEKTHICHEVHSEMVKYCFEDDCAFNKDYSFSICPHFVFIIEKDGNVKIICESKEIKKLFFLRQ